jgi:hypothetical protein
MEGAMARMEECLSGIKDERRQSGHFPHKLIDVLVIGLTAILAGWDEYTVTEDFGKAKERFFRTFLELPQGIPDEKTFARVFSWVEPGSADGGGPGLAGGQREVERPQDHHFVPARLCGKRENHG